MIRNVFVGAMAVAAIAFASDSVNAQGFGGRFAGARAAISSPNVNGFGASAGWLSPASVGDYWAYQQSMQRPWHGEYYYLKTGQPTALVVPPTVTMQTNYSWGVSQNTMSPVYHQFSGKASNGGGGGVFKATPYWPSHTDQFGIYPVRGPW